MNKYSNEFTQFWSIYPNDLAMGKPGSKHKASLAWEKIKPEDQKEVMLATRELIKHDRSDIKPDRWPHASTYLNQQYYTRPIESKTEKAVKSSVACGICGADADIPKVRRCVECYAREVDRWAEKRKQICLEIIPIASGESKLDYCLRVKDKLLADLKSGKLSMSHKNLSDI